MPRKIRFYSEWEALDYLEKDCKIANRTLSFKKNSLGLKKLGAVDYLVNYHKYSLDIT